MATYGRIAKYSKSEDWTQYEERLKCYFEANNIDDAGKQQWILLINPKFGASGQTIRENV